MKSAWFILSALVAGMLLGIGVEMVSVEWGTASLPYVEWIGLLWLNALKMTIIPLIVALLVTGITATADAARAGKLAGRAVAIFVGANLVAGLMTLVVLPLLLRAFPMSAAAAEGLRHGLGGSTEAVPSPTFTDFVLGLIPTNPIAAAADTSILPLIVFTTIFAFAISRVGSAERATLSGFFKALGDAMLVVIGWVLALAPLGVFALGYALAIKAGVAAFGGLVHYVLMLSAIGACTIILGLALAMFVVGVPLPRFVRAMVPTFAVAISTQSSLASLPAMLKSSEELGVDPKKADIVLPLAVALFKLNRTVSAPLRLLVLAQVYHIPLSAGTVAIFVVTIIVLSFGTVGLPSGVLPIPTLPAYMAAGIPIEGVVILEAVDAIPDIFKTVLNVTGDMSAATILSRNDR